MCSSWKINHCWSLSIKSLKEWQTTRHWARLLGSKKLEIFLTIWQSPGFVSNSSMMKQLFSSTFCYEMPYRFEERHNKQGYQIDNKLKSPKIIQKCIIHNWTKLPIFPKCVEVEKRWAHVFPLDITFSKSYQLRFRSILKISSWTSFGWGRTNAENIGWVGSMPIWTLFGFGTFTC